MDSGNPLKALESFINNSSTPPRSSLANYGFPAFNGFLKSHRLTKEEKYRNNFQTLLDSTELQLEDFLENYDDSQQDEEQQFDEEYETESESYKMEEYSPQDYQSPIYHQQPYCVTYSFNKSTLNELEQQQQQRQRKRNEEIARILSPIQKLKKHNKQNAPNSTKSNSVIRRKFSLLNGPCNKKKTQPKPTKYSNSMKEWQEKIIPIIQRVSLKSELL